MKKALKIYLFGASAWALTFSLCADSAYGMTPEFYFDPDDPSFLGSTECASTPPTCTSLGYELASTCPSGTTALLCLLDTRYRKCIPHATCDTQLYKLTSCPSGATCKSCGGKYRVTACPTGQYLDSSLSCSEPTGTNCAYASVGDFVYDDHTCGTSNDSGNSAVGIVIDPIRRIMMNVYSSSSGWQWADIADDIAGITNYTTESAAENDFSGYANTVVMFNMEYNHIPAYHNTTALTPCYDWTMDDDWLEYVPGNTDNYDFYGWYLPTLGELKLLEGIVDTLNSRLPINYFDPLGYDAGDDEILLSSTEVDANYAWGYQVSSGSSMFINKLDYQSHYTVRCFHKY